MVNCGKIQKVVSLDMFDAAQIRTFLCSPAGRKMRGAAEKGRLHREQPFVLGVEARQVDPRWNSEETVLVQGIIDAWFTEEDGKIVLIDYKTDRVAGLPDPEEEMLRRYRVQLKLYQEALERLTGRTVKDTWIYSFDLGDIIPVEG